VLEENEGMRIVAYTLHVRHLVNMMMFAALAKRFSQSEDGRIRGELAPVDLHS
jgi:hypothetical protein